MKLIQIYLFTEINFKFTNYNSWHCLTRWPMNGTSADRFMTDRNIYVPGSIYLYEKFFGRQCRNISWSKKFQIVQVHDFTSPRLPVVLYRCNPSTNGISSWLFIFRSTVTSCHCGWIIHEIKNKSLKAIFKVSLKAI